MLDYNTVCLEGDKVHSIQEPRLCYIICCAESILLFQSVSCVRAGFVKRNIHYWNFDIWFDTFLKICKIHFEEIENYTKS